jgi:hypothetical protein
MRSSSVTLEASIEYYSEPMETLDSLDLFFKEFTRLIIEVNCCRNHFKLNLYMGFTEQRF